MSLLYGNQCSLGSVNISLRKVQPSLAFQSGSQCLITQTYLSRLLDKLQRLCYSLEDTGGQILTTTGLYYSVQDSNSNYSNPVALLIRVSHFFGLLEVINIFLSDNSAFAKPLLEVNQAIEAWSFQTFVLKLNKFSTVEMKNRLVYKCAIRSQLVFRSRIP